MSKRRNTLQHDPLFKNLVTDFPEDTLRWLLPEAEARFGKILQVDFLRQEMPKHWLSDEGRELDIPIKYTFERQSVLITLIEHQNDKDAFSIYKLAHYTLDVMELFPELPVIPIVIFADERKWRKDVQRELSNTLWGETWLHFHFQKIKLKDLQASELQDSQNPVLTILTPTFDYPQEERLDWTVWAYTQLFRLLDSRRFQKYMDFVDKYAKIKPEEKTQILETLTEKTEGVMIREAILQEGIQQGIQQGMQAGIQQGMEQGMEKGRQAGMEQGMEKGMEKGMEAGIQQGELIGKIHLSQKLLKQPLEAEETLRRLPLKELRTFAESLEKELLS